MEQFELAKSCLKEIKEEGFKAVGRETTVTGVINTMHAVNEIAAEERNAHKLILIKEKDNAKNTGINR